MMPPPSPGAPGAGSGADDDIDLGRLLATLWRGKLWIALGTALGLAGAALAIANTEPTWQADALLQLEEQSAALALPSTLSEMVNNDPRSATEIEILRSRMVLGQAVADLNLDWRVMPDRAPVAGTLLARHDVPLADLVLPDRFARPGDRVALRELIVPPGWVGRPLRLTAGDGGRFRLVTPDGAALDGAVGTALTLPELGFTITLDAIEAPAGRAWSIVQVGESAAIAALRGRLSVSERGRGSGILELRLTGPSPAENIRALNAILAAYQRQNIARSAAQAEGSLSFIRDQLPQAEADLRAAEAALNAFRREQVSVDLTLETQTILTQVSRIEGELAELQRREDELALRFTPAHPTYRLLLEERARLAERLEGLRERVGALPETQRQIVNLTRDLELAQRLHLDLLTRAQQVEVLRASTIGSVRIIDEAAASGGPVAPRRQMFLAVGLLIGAGAGAGLVLLRNWLRKGIQDTADLERLGLPALATINYSRAADSRGRRKGALPILALDQPADTAVEAFRSLRTSLHFGMLEARTPSLTVTSSHPGAGKSFVATNLAVVTAQSGQRVCLIDADLRRGQLRRHFGLPRHLPGLADVLAGDRAVADVLAAGPVDNLYLVTTGRYPPNPSELLMRAEMGALVAWCAEHFDLTIFDTPPALAVTDPVVIARATGAAVVVARHDVTLPGEIDAVMKAFAAAGLRLSGGILNGFDPRKAKAGYGYGYGYRYDYGRRDD